MENLLPVLYKQENDSQLAGGQVVESQIQAEWVGGVHVAHSVLHKLCSTEKFKVWGKKWYHIYFH